MTGEKRNLGSQDGNILCKEKIKMFSFNHVTINVSDLEETLKFYELFSFKKCKEYHDENIDIVMKL